MEDLELEKVHEIINGFKKDNYNKLYNKTITEKLAHLRELFEQEGIDFMDYIKLVESAVETQLQKRQKQGIH